MKRKLIIIILIITLVALLAGGGILLRKVSIQRQEHIDELMQMELPDVVFSHQYVYSGIFARNNCKLLHLHQAIEESEYDRNDFKWRLAVTGAEPHSEELRCKIQDKLGIEVYNCYGMSELNGPGVAFECIFRKGMHIWEDRYIIEIIDPVTLEPVPEGEVGELVVTILHRDAMPLLRYRTRDLTRIIPEPCACGRTHRRLARFTGRSDDMLIINGVNVFPSQIEEVLLKVNGVGANYLIVVEKQGDLDKLTVQTEVTPEMFTDDTRPLNALKERLKAEMSALITINPVIELKESGSMPVSEGKAKRVDDRRPKDF